MAIMDVRTAINPIEVNGLLKMKLNNGVIIKIAIASKIKTLIMRNLWFILFPNVYGNCKMIGFVFNLSFIQLIGTNHQLID